MKSKKLGNNRRLVCASPVYLHENGVPQHPDDLAHHNCIVMRFGTQTFQDWSFEVEGKRKTCRVKGNRIANDGDLLLMDERTLRFLIEKPDSLTGLLQHRPVLLLGGLQNALSPTSFESDVFQKVIHI